MLKEAGESEKINIQLAKLSLLSQDTPLVIHRNIRPYWIINISKNEQNFQYQNIRTSLPLFYLHDKEASMPLVKLSTGQKRHKTRSDKRIENNAYLPTISAYRYIK